MGTGVGLRASGRAAMPPGPAPLNEQPKADPSDGGTEAQRKSLQHGLRGESPGSLPTNPCSSLNVAGTN